MTAHLHETDRILATLGEAIEKLRAWDSANWWPGELHVLTHEVANDLALLHGAVSAEAQKWEEDEGPLGRAFRRGRTIGESVAQALTGDEAEDMALFAEKLRELVTVQPKDIDVKVSEAGRRRFLRAVKDEEIRAEVDRGEHREGDWDA